MKSSFIEGTKHSVLRNSPLALRRIGSVTTELSGKCKVTVAGWYVSTFLSVINFFKSVCRSILIRSSSSKNCILLNGGCADATSTFISNNERIYHLAFLMIGEDWLRWFSKESYKTKGKKNEVNYFLIPDNFYGPGDCTTIGFVASHTSGFCSLLSKSASRKDRKSEGNL